MKALLKYLAHESNHSSPVLMVDFHGHSRRKNLFLYGCSPELSWKASDRKKALKASMKDQSYLCLPLALDSCAHAFSLNQCCHTIEKKKEPTARIALYRQLGLKLSYTLECSQAGCGQGLYSGLHLGINQLTQTGSQFCSALLALQFKSDPNTCRPIPVVPEVNQK